MTETQIKSAKRATKANADKRKAEAGKTIVTRRQRAAKATPKKVVVKQPRKGTVRIPVKYEKTLRTSVPKLSLPKISYDDLRATDRKMQEMLTPARKITVETDLKDIKRRFYEEQGVKYNKRDLVAVALGVALVYTTGWVLWLAFGGK